MTAETFALTPTGLKAIILATLGGSHPGAATVLAAHPVTRPSRFIAVRIPVA